MNTFYAILVILLLTDETISSIFIIVEQSFNAHPLVPASADATELDAVNPNYCPLRRTGSSQPWLAICDLDHQKLYAWTHVYSAAIWRRWLKA